MKQQIEELYAKEIVAKANDINNTKMDNQTIKQRCIIYQNMYAEAVTESNGLIEPIRTYYIAKEAYRLAEKLRTNTIT